jgi:hypothetical protein
MIVSMDYPGVHKTYNQVCVLEIYMCGYSLLLYTQKNAQMEYKISNTIIVKNFYIFIN